MKNAKDGALGKLPNEMFLRIFSYLDLQSVLTARCVTKKWKMLVDTSRDLDFVCHLTDETISTVINSTMEVSVIQIHDLLQPIAVASATRGIGRLLAITDRIEIRDKQINPTELLKVMRFTTKSLRDLSFHRCGKIVVIPMLTDWTFWFLSKLYIRFNRYPKNWHTRVFEQLSKNQQSFPSLEHFKVVYELDHVDQLYSREALPSSLHLFRNYLAIVNIVVGFKKTLKTVEIIRDEVYRTALVLRADLSGLLLNNQRRAEVQKCIEGLESVQLEELHLTPLAEEGVFPWILETTLLERQQQLKGVNVNRKLCSPRADMINMAMTLPINPTYFTSVKISVTTFGSEPVNLNFFAQCSSLKTLWLMFYRGVRIGRARDNSLRFTNLEQLPTSITSLHLKSSQQDAIIIHQQTILTRAQLRWVIDNLKNLESFWLQLVIEDRVDEPINPENLGQQEDEQNDNDQHDDNRPAVPEIVDHLLEHLVEDVVRQLNGGVNAQANINLATFRELVMLPRLREMKFDMLKASQMDAILELGEDGNPWAIPMGRNVALDDIWEYIDVCHQQKAIMSFSTETTSFFPFAFIELTIKKKILTSGAYFTL